MRKSIWVSLHTDSETVAKTKAPIAWQHPVEAWEARLGGDTADADRREAAAVLGAVPDPQITVTRALDLYWGLAADKTIGKSEDQMRRWKNPCMKAVRNFVAVVGDKALPDITGDDMLDFRGWWFEKLESEDLTPNSANKDLIHLGDVLKTVNRMKRLGYGEHVAIGSQTPSGALGVPEGGQLQPWQLVLVCRRLVLNLARQLAKGKAQFLLCQGALAGESGDRHRDGPTLAVYLWICYCFLTSCFLLVGVCRIVLTEFRNASAGINGGGISLW